ncbi:MAG: peroxidase family protein [Kiloniellales bacterium]
MILQRPIDGADSNALYSDWGAVGQELLRLSDAGFADGIGEMVGDRPEPRAISNALSQQSEETPSEIGASDFLWAWGQFIDHDLDLTEAGTVEFAPIQVPLGDPWFDPDSQGGALIPFLRVHHETGSGEDSPRAYVNEITAFLDASMVYGSDNDTAAALRDDGGRLLIGANGLLLQTNTTGVLAGDVRAAENVALTSLHTLFVREHNRLVAQLEVDHPDWSSDDLYHAARMRVEAEIQAITYNDFLPILVGEEAIAHYQGYDSSVNPGISVEFSTAAYRFGHSLLSATLERVNEDGTTIDDGDLALRDAFFNPAVLAASGIDPVLRGLGSGDAQKLDTLVVEDVRSFLFGDPASGGLDLASINIQRGRDLGVASYNDLREALGLARAEDFSDITSARLCTISGSGPGPEDTLIGDELEGVVEGHDDAAHVVNVLPFAVV